MLISEAFEAFEVDELLSENRSPKTVDSYRGTLNSLLRAVGQDIEVAFLSYIHIIQWKKYMMSCNNSGSHMASQLRELRRVLTYLQDHRFVSLDPTEIKIPRFKYNRTAWLTTDEVRRFLGVIENPRDRALFTCLFSCGGRISELLSLDRNSIVDGMALVWGKGKQKGKDEPSKLEFDDNALLILEKYVETRTDNLPFLFPSPQKSPITGKRERFTVKSCDLLAHKYAHRAKIDKRVTTHVCRHTFATDLEMNGADLNTIRKQLGHKKLETTKIYSHASETRERDKYDKYHTPVPTD